MSLLTIERSSSSDNLSQLSGSGETDDDQVDADFTGEEVFSRPRTSSFEGFFASKGAAYAIPDGDFARKATRKGGELQSHLQGMVNLIRDEDVMRMVVKLESQANYTRYLSIVTTYGANDEEESVILGFDWIEDNVTIGLVIPLWSSVATSLDGDGGFELRTEHRHYVFKPVSVQCLWTAMQWIHRCLATAHRAKHFSGGFSHAWLGYYKDRIASPRECINFWEFLEDLANTRDMCYSYFDKVKTDEELLKGSIRHKLREILTRFDLEEVTCRQVREELESEMKMSLQHLKSYVEEQLFIILGQMDSSSKITDHIYLGSEWNASNLEELKDNGVGYILNVTIEIDNFFPGTFEYMNIRLHDIEESDLLRHWGKTYRFLHKAKEKGSAALVHCRRGISRSASTVVAYLMKEHNLSLHDAMKLVKSKRSIVQPNAGFWKQLIIYEGILNSSRHRHSSLFRRRSNSDTTACRRPSKKFRDRHKKDKGSETDHVDSTPDHAHTLPKMAGGHDNPPVLNCNSPETPDDKTASNEEESADVSPLLAHASTRCDNQETPESESSGEVSPSESEEDSSSPDSKLRRTLSEPVMKTAGNLTEMSQILGKPRARTFVESGVRDDHDSDGIARSPPRIPEVVEREQGDILAVDVIQDSQANLELSQVKVQSTSDKQSNVSSEIVEEQLRPFSETVALEINDLEGKLCEELDLNATYTTTDEKSSDGTEPVAERPKVSENFTIPTESFTRVVDVDTTEKSSDITPKEDDGVAVSVGLASSEYHRLHSRSIGEKLEDKLLLKHGKSESSENVRKVEGRGRVRRRERKSKSDLQLSNSGFVKRHTQIIEEQMLYSVWNNSEKRLASGICDNDAQMINLDVSTNTEKLEHDSGRDAEICSKQDLGADLEKGSEKDYEKDSKKDSKQDYEKDVEMDVEQDSESHSENGKSVRSAADELQSIVQEVNAEAKKDIKSLTDMSQLPVVSRNESTDCPQGNDDVCIDEMAWIDLTHHHGDVVKRRSAAFENVSEKNKLAVRTGLNTGVASVRSREASEKDKCCTPSVDETMSDVKNQKAECSSRTNVAECPAAIDIPKLDLEQLKDEKSLETFPLPERSNSITVEDYNEWESSGVRERTKILEKIIAKTGGSFPSPRSRNVMKAKSQEEQEAEANNLDRKAKRCLSSSIENSAAEGESLQCSREDVSRRRSSSCPVGETTRESTNENEAFGDDIVKVLVDRFEGRDGNPETSNNRQTVESLG